MGLTSAHLHRRLREALEVRVVCPDGERRGNVTWMDHGWLYLLAGRKLPQVGGRLEACLFQSEGSDLARVRVEVESTHEGAENPFGFGTLHVCRVEPLAGTEDEALARLIERLNPSAQRGGPPASHPVRTASQPRWASEESTVAYRRSERRHTGGLSQPLYAPGDPPMLMVSFHSELEMEAALHVEGSYLRLVLAPVEGPETLHFVHVVARLPSGITVQLDARLVREDTDRLVFEAPEVPRWALAAMRLAG